MTNTSSRTGAAPFAHLLAITGLGRGRRAEAETPAKETPAPEGEGDGEADEGGDDDADQNGTPAQSSEGDDDEEQDAEADAGDGDDEGVDGHNEHEATAYRAGLAAGRERENLRCARIFQSADAAGRPDLAATLAFTTRNTSAEAERILGTANAVQSRGRGLSARMGNRNEARPGPGAERRGAGTFVERLAAAKKVAGVD